MTIAHPLSWILLLPVVCVAVLLAIPASQVTLIRRISNAALLLPLLLSGWVFLSYNHSAGGFQFVEKISWVSQLGISYHLGVDGISCVLLMLVGLCSYAGVFMMGSVKERVKEYYIFYLLTVFSAYGAFLSLDIFVFYFLHEIATIPSYILIAVWGSSRKEYAAIKLTLYLAAGATLALIGLLALYLSTGLQTFDFVQIQQHLLANPLPVAVQNWIFPLIVLGFGITVTLWPFYTWAPVGYAAAPTSISMMHAGVLKKMGAYAILRFAIELMPQGAQTWMPILATLAVFNIVYCGLVALTQRNLKYILGYSSCSHMGYVLLGLACLNSIGLNGAVFLMFAHGVMAALGFALVGYICDRTNTSNLEDLGGLAKQMPFIATCFTMMALASAGVPGFANFAAEIMVLLGAWDQYRWQTVLAVLGIVITAIYMFKAIRFALHGPPNPQWAQLSDAQTPLQKLPFILLLAALLIVGCWPSVILKHIDSATKPIVESIKAH